MPKPQTAAGYALEESEQVKAACLTVAALLGDLMNELCIVGGLVPSFICGTDIDPAAIDDDAHCGTNDLDVGLSVELLDDERYKEVSDRLRARGFHPDTTEGGKTTRQRWRWEERKVTVDFLIAPTPDGEASGKDVRIQNLEGDFAALVVKGLGLAFEERITVPMEGLNLLGDHVKRDVHFCGPAAFIVLKAFAYHLRSEPKDAYDLVYVVRRWSSGLQDLASRLADHARTKAEVVGEALAHLAADFETRGSAGPRDTSRFLTGSVDDEAVADAHGAVADLLSACAERGVLPIVARS